MSLMMSPYTVLLRTPVKQDNEGNGSTNIENLLFFSGSVLLENNNDAYSISESELSVNVAFSEKTSHLKSGNADNKTSNNCKTEINVSDMNTSGSNYDPAAEIDCDFPCITRQSRARVFEERVRKEPTRNVFQMF